MLNKLVVDIARYTEGVDALPLHEASVQMVILKVDSQFLKNASILANSGMPIAAYHWIDPTVDADQQVANTLNTLRTSGLPVLAIFADFEQWWSNWDQWYKAILKELSWNLVSRFSANKLSGHAKQVLEGLAASEWKTFGYTRASFVDEFAPEASSWIPEFRWWLAHYISIDKQTLSWAEFKARILPLVDFLPAMPPGLARDQVVGHQFTGDKLFLPGLYEDVFRIERAKADINFFDEDFMIEIGAVPNPNPLPEPLHEAIVTASPRLNVRSGPSTSHPILYKLMEGEPVKIAELNNGWARLRSFEEEWCSADFLHIVDEDSPDPGENGEDITPQPIEVDFPGVTYQKLRRFNADCHVLLFDMSNKRFHITPYTGLKTVSTMARKVKAPIVVNGDGWGIAGFPNSISSSDGKVDQKNQFDFRPWINIAKNNTVTFDSNWRKWKKNVYNTVSGDRYIINKDGKYNQNINDFHKDPRTAIGLTQDGKLILIVADGRTSESAGLSFRELGFIFEEFRTKTAINLDGGGSSALWIKDRIVNVPIENGVPGRERAVANHLCVFME